MICRFVTLAEVQERMNLSKQVVAASPSLESAIQSAHLRIESELSTRFDTGSQVDVFLCDPTKGYVVPDAMFRLRLARGFLRADPAVVVKIIESPTDVEGSDVTDQCVISAERGHVFIPESLGTDEYVRVEYDFGFDFTPPVAPVTDGTFDGEQPPDWLKEAVLAYVPAVFYMGQPTARGKDVATTKSVVEDSGKHAMSVLAPHNRNLIFSLPPVFSSP